MKNLLKSLLTFIFMLSFVVVFAGEGILYLTNTTRDVKKVEIYIAEQYIETIVIMGGTTKEYHWSYRHGGCRNSIVLKIQGRKNTAYPKSDCTYRITY